MTDSWTSVGQSSMKSEVQAAFLPSFIKKRNKDRDVRKVEAAPPSKPLKKEEAADFKVGEEAINEKMKVLIVKQKAGLYVPPATRDGSSTSQSRKRGLSSLSKFTALIIGPELVDAGEGETNALRKHFEEKCGSIEDLSVDKIAGRAYIDFASVESLKKALRLDKTSFCGYPVNIHRLYDKDSTFRAVIRGFDAREPDDLGTLRNHFKNYCGEIEDIIVPSPEYAYIDFVNKSSLYEALELNDTTVDGYPVTVKKAYSLPSTYKAKIRGFDTCASAEKVKKDLRKHFQICGWIEEISVHDGRAYIAFESLHSLFKALDLNNTKVDGHTITVRQPGFNFHTTRFRADISWSHDMNLEDVRPYFEKCGGIAGIHFSNQSAARIDFTNMDSLKKALKLNNTPTDGNHTFTVKDCSPCCGRGGRGGYCGGRGGRGGGSSSETDSE